MSDAERRGRKYGGSLPYVLRRPGGCDNCGRDGRLPPALCGPLRQVLWRKNKSSLSYTLQKIKDAFTVYSKFQKFNLIKSFIFVIFLSINFLKKVSEQKI